MPTPETNTGNFPEYGLINLNYFFGSASDAARREKFIRRGLVPTNNLSLYFNDEPEAELHPGIRNPYDYRQHPFGPVIQLFKEQHTELWCEAVSKALAASDLSGKCTTIIMAGGTISPEISSASEEAYWAKVEVFDRAFRILAPQLEAAGINPLDACK